MGFFGSKEKEAPEPETENEDLTPDQLYARRLKELGDIDEDGEKLDILEGYFESIGESFDSFKIKRNSDGSEIQLRGKFQNFPVKIKAESVASSFGWEVVCKVASNVETLSFEYDTEKIPLEKDKDDDFADEDLIRVFIDKGLFFESDEQSEIDYALAFWHDVSDGLRTKIKELLTKNNYTIYTVSDSDIECGVWDLDDLLTSSLGPISLIVELCRLMVMTAKEIEAVEVVVDQVSGETKKFRLVDCHYCGSKYALDQSAKCVNCGSGYQP